MIVAYIHRNFHFVLDVDVKVFTVASDETEGYQRYVRSANYYNVDVSLPHSIAKRINSFVNFRLFQVTTLGMNEKWLGGSMDSLGGGYKINLLRTALEPYKDDTEKIVLFTDSYDVVFTTTLDVIVHKFKKIDARILFGAEKFVWPDETVEHLYPPVAKLLPKYLNSGLFMGKWHFSLSLHSG